MEFQGKYILITGASRGIGSACARLFANRGGTVAVHYGSNVEAASDKQKTLHGEGHLLVQADIADPDAVQRVVDTVLANFSRIDVLVNNAGIFEEQPLPEVDYVTWRESWTRVLSTNLDGTCLDDLLCCSADDPAGRWKDHQYLVKDGVLRQAGGPRLCR